MNKPLPIHETFHAFQGEGVHMGRSAFFIRTYGCPVHCPWCDSAGTWHPNWIPPEGVVRRSAESLVEEARMAMPEFIVVTGGEPAVHDLTDLCEAAHEAMLPVHLETSGAFPLEGKGKFDWVTVSPKKWKMPLADLVLRADELKIIVEELGDIPFYYEMMKMLGWHPTGPEQPVWLHPEWGQRENPEVLNAICQAVSDGRGMFRAGWQIHKLYKVDQLDNRVRSPVPLGGNEMKGY